jgi:hypothetical protein
LTNFISTSCVPPLSSFHAAFFPRAISHGARVRRQQVYSVSRSDPTDRPETPPLQSIAHDRWFVKN